MADAYFNPYLGEVINLKDFTPGKIQLITTNCGSGKTYCALHRFPELATKGGKVVYLTDTVALKEYLGLQDECKIYDPSDKLILSGNIINFNNSNNKIIVMTYAKMGVLLKYNPHLFDGVEVIICDEIHQLANFIDWDRERFKKLHPMATDTDIDLMMSCSSNAYLAAHYITQFADKIEPDGTQSTKPKIVIGMSATPTKAYALFQNKYETIRINAKLRAYETLQTLYYLDLVELLNELPVEPTLIYIPKISSINKALEIVRARGIKAEGIWSIHNTKYPMTKEQLELREYILKEQEIPKDYNFIFYNSAYETGININSKIKTVVVHSIEEDTRIQSRNRVRANLNKIYYYANNNEKVESSIPVRFLNTPLGKEEKKELCEIISMKENNRTIKGWITVKKKILEMGYSIKTISQRVGDKRVSKDIIS